jgi:hypothetical protein
LDRAQAWGTSLGGIEGRGRRLAASVPAAQEQQGDRQNDPSSESNPIVVHSVLLHPCINDSSSDAKS